MKRDRRTGWAIGNQFYGADGYLVIDNRNKAVYLGQDQKKGPEATQAGDHYANFISAVRSRNMEDLTADVLEGAMSCDLMHLANVSYRVGRTINWDQKTRTCIGDPEANKLLTRQYRAPYIVPAKV